MDSPFRAPVVDGIVPVLSQEGVGRPSDCKTCLGEITTGIIPTSSEMSKLVYIPKSGRHFDDNVSKSCRSIIRISLSLNGMKKVLDRHRRDKVVEGQLACLSEGKWSEPAIS